MPKWTNIPNPSAIQLFCAGVGNTAASSRVWADHAGTVLVDKPAPAALKAAYLRKSLLCIEFIKLF
jgi:hypothetical protein